MKFNLLFLFVSSFITQIFSQDEVHFCAQKHQDSKGTIDDTKYLTIAEENEANKYDVSYYELNLFMTNQNSSISGTAIINGKTLFNLDSIVLELDQSLVISELRLNGVATAYTRYTTALKIPLNAFAGVFFFY